VPSSFGKWSRSGTVPDQLDPFGTTTFCPPVALVMGGPLANLQRRKTAPEYECEPRRRQTDRPVPPITASYVEQRTSPFTLEILRCGSARMTRVQPWWASRYTGGREVLRSPPAHGQFPITQTCTTGAKMTQANR
jgi:hypothetical protein